MNLQSTSLNILVMNRAGRTGPADPATAGPILTKFPVATHNHDLCRTLSCANCNFDVCFVPLFFSLPSFLLYAITYKHHYKYFGHNTRDTNHETSWIYGSWRVTLVCYELLAYLACRRLKIVITKNLTCLLRFQMLRR